MRVMAFHHPSAVIVGSLLGVVLALFWPVIVDQAERITDLTWPVVVGTAEVVDRKTDSVQLRIQARKIRDCRYLKLQAFSRMPHGILRDAYIKRLDRAESQATRPVGVTFDAGYWELWPTLGAVGFIVYAQHDCDGRQVTSILAEVNL